MLPRYSLPLTLLKGSLQIVYCCWIAFELAFCYFMIVETKGLTLEETAALFDGESYADQIARQAIEAADNGNVEEVRVVGKDYDEKLSESYARDVDSKA